MEFDYLGEISERKFRRIEATRGTTRPGAGETRKAGDTSRNHYQYVGPMGTEI